MCRLVIFRGNIFTDEERLLFNMTEEITLIHQHGLSDETYEKQLKFLGEILVCFLKKLEK